MVVHGHHRHQAVDRHGAGVVGHHQRTALGGDVLGAADLDAEPLLGDRAQRGQEEALGDLAVEAVVVDDVVAVEPATQEGQQLGQPALPLGAEDLAARRLEGCEPVLDRDAAQRVRSSVVVAERASRSALGRRRAAAGSGRLGAAASAAQAARRPAWRRPASAAAGLRQPLGGSAWRRGLARLPAPGCARPRTACRAPCRGRVVPPVPIGMTSASLTPDLLPLPGPRWCRRRGCDRSRRTSRPVVYVGSKPSSARIRVVSTPRP